MLCSKPSGETLSADQIRTEAQLEGAGSSGFSLGTVPAGPQRRAAARGELEGPRGEAGRLRGQERDAERDDGLRLRVRGDSRTQTRERAAQRAGAQVRKADLSLLRYLKANFCIQYCIKSFVKF